MNLDNPYFLYWFLVQVAVVTGLWLNPRRQEMNPLFAGTLVLFSWLIIPLLLIGLVIAGFTALAGYAITGSWPWNYTSEDDG